MTKQEKIEKIQNELSHFDQTTNYMYEIVMDDKEKRKIFQDYFQLIYQFTCGEEVTHEGQIKKIKTILIHMIKNDLV